MDGGLTYGGQGRRVGEGRRSEARTAREAEAEGAYFGGHFGPDGLRGLLEARHCGGWEVW